MFDCLGLHLYKSFSWRKKIFPSWEAFCLLHSDSCSCNKYTRNLKGLVEKGESCFSKLFFQTQWSNVRNCGVSRLRVLLSWDSGFQISHTCTRAHDWKQRVSSEWNELSAYILRGSWTFGDIPWSPIIALVLGPATVPIEEESWKFQERTYKD